jgi:outer membrane protein, heavy metal efflux system
MTTLRRPGILPLLAAFAFAPPASAAWQHDHSQHEQGGAASSASAHASHTNVRVDVPELPILEGADPSVETIPEGPAVRVEGFERRAETTSPDIARAQAAVEVARGRAKQAGLLPNPIVGYSAEEIQGGEPAHGGQHGFAIDQTIPLGGKLGKRRDVLLGSVREAEAMLEVARLGVINGVRLAFFDALAAQQRVDLERRMVRLLQEAVRTSYGLYNVGQADRPDVLEIEIEARQAQLRLISARNEMERARQLLAITSGAPDERFGRLDGSLAEALRDVETTAVAQILDRSPEVVAARAGVERAQLAIRSAKAERYPDLFLSGGARYNREHKEIDLLHAGRVGWQGFVEAGVSIPVFDRNQGGIAAAEAERRVAEAELKRLELGIRSRFATAMSRYREAVRISEVYRSEIIPRAEEAYRLYVEKYQEMQAAYPQVLIARRTLLQANLDYVSALESLYRAGLPLRGFLIGEGTSSTAGPLLVSSPARGAAEGGRAH